MGVKLSTLYDEIFKLLREAELQKGSVLTRGDIIDAPFGRIKVTDKLLKEFKNATNR